MIQEILVFILVIFSIIYLLRFTWIKFIKTEKSCETCSVGKTLNESITKQNTNDRVSTL